MIDAIPHIQRATAEHYGLSLRQLLGSKRTRSIARPRQLAMVLCKDQLGLSYPVVGEAFKRDQTTVQHAKHKIDSEWGYPLQGAAIAIMTKAHAAWMAERKDADFFTPQRHA